MLQMTGRRGVERIFGLIKCLTSTHVIVTRFDLKIRSFRPVLRHFDISMRRIAATTQAALFCYPLAAR